jgi:2-methylcitrate dehydratase PrpD
VLSEPVQRMMARVQTIRDPEIEARGFERIRSTVEVDLVDGRTLVQDADERYRGGPEWPFTRDELHEKFTDCASLVLPPEAIRRVLDLVESLDEVAGIGELVRALAPSAAAQMAAR